MKKRVTAALGTVLLAIALAAFTGSALAGNGNGNTPPGQAKKAPAPSTAGPSSNGSTSQNSPSQPGTKPASNTAKNTSCNTGGGTGSSAMCTPSNGFSAFVEGAEGRIEALRQRHDCGADRQQPRRSIRNAGQGTRQQPAAQGVREERPLRRRARGEVVLEQVCDDGVGIFVHEDDNDDDGLRIDERSSVADGRRRDGRCGCRDDDVRGRARGACNRSRSPWRRARCRRGQADGQAALHRVPGVARPAGRLRADRSRARASPLCPRGRLARTAVRGRKRGGRRTAFLLSPKSARPRLP
jgi:hypothetical protein